MANQNSLIMKKPPQITPMGQAVPPAPQIQTVQPMTFPSTQATTSSAPTGLVVSKPQKQNRFELAAQNYVAPPTVAGFGGAQWTGDHSKDIDASLKAAGTNTAGALANGSLKSIQDQWNSVYGNWAENAGVDEKLNNQYGRMLQSKHYQNLTNPDPDRLARKELQAERKENFFANGGTLEQWKAKRGENSSNNQATLSTPITAQIAPMGLVASPQGLPAGAMATPDAQRSIAAPIAQAAQPLPAQAQQTALPTTAPATPATGQLDPSLNVANWYRSTLGRDGDKGGIEFWENQLKSGADPAQVYAAFREIAGKNSEIVNNGSDLTSANIYKGPQSTNKNTYVDDWGVNTLGRNLTPQEIAMWDAKLKANPTAEGAQEVYKQFLEANKAEVKNPMDLASASQIAKLPIQPIPGDFSKVDPTGIKAKGYTADKWEVEAPQTVRGQLQTLVDPNDPLNVQAATRAKQQMNALGLVNSSIGISAAQDAVLKNAMEIAKQDAATYADSGKFNTSEENVSRRFGAEADNNAATQNANNALQLFINQADNETKLAMAQMDQDQKMQLAELDYQYGQAKNNSVAASDLYKQMMVNITNIQNNKDMDEAAKETAIKNQYEIYRNGMDALTGLSKSNPISQLNIADYFADISFGKDEEPVKEAEGEAEGGGPTVFNNLGDKIKFASSNR